MKNTGFAAVTEEVRSVPTPEATRSWQPVPHGYLLDELIRTATYSGIQLQPERARFSLTKDGARMFGIMPASIPGSDRPDWEFTLGVRNSHDQTFPVGLVVGQRVIVCSNLMFVGEVQARTKHTRWVLTRLGELTGALCTRWASKALDMAAQADRLKGTALSEQELEHLVLETIRRDIVGSRQIRPLLEEVESPQNGFDPRTAWGYQNCVTEVLKTSTPEALRTQSFKLDTLLQELITTASYN